VAQAVQGVAVVTVAQEVLVHLVKVAMVVVRQAQHPLIMAVAVVVEQAQLVEQEHLQLAAMVELVQPHLSQAQALPMQVAVVEALIMAVQLAQAVLAVVERLEQQVALLQILE
jgi:hypothetical protein